MHILIYSKEQKLQNANWNLTLQILQFFSFKYTLGNV